MTKTEFSKICPTCNKQYDDSLTFCPEDGDVLEQDLAALIGTNLDGLYVIEALLGRGGMGMVYRARHLLLGDYVAIKMLPAQLTSDSETLRRFLREGQIARRFRHPNVVTVHDLRANNGSAYMVMEYVEGSNLRQELQKQGPFLPTRTLDILEPIADALNAAHALGIVHRDLKLDNIMIHRAENGDFTVKLLDLGIAKMNNGGVTAVTQAGQLLGTPGYMSPEQWGVEQQDSAPKIDGRADIYSFAVVFFELIAGRLPFDCDSLQQFAAAHMFAKPPLLHELVTDVPREFGLAIDRAMSKSRADRPATCQEFIAELRHALTTASTRLLPRIAPEGEIRIGQQFETTLHLYQFNIVTINAEGAPVEQHHGQAQFFSEDLGDNVKLEMTWIPEGTYLMGSPEQELKRSRDEDPQHQVNIESFFIGKFPITQAQWRAVAALPQIKLALNPAPSSFIGHDRPVENVSWEDCQEFCARLSAKTGRRYLLPSEAQWEYACRANTITPFHFGETINAELANYNGLFRYGSGPRSINRGETSTVGSLGVANSFGLFDMHGNVWEWCSDSWHNNYQQAPADGSSWEEGGDATRRVMRGGSWYASSSLCRSATRAGSGPMSKNDMLGFRVIAFISKTGQSSSNTSNLVFHWPNSSLDTIKIEE